MFCQIFPSIIKYSARKFITVSGNCGNNKRITKGRGKRTCVIVRNENCRMDGDREDNNNSNGRKDEQK